MIATLATILIQTIRLMAKKFNLAPESLIPEIKKLSREKFTELSENFILWDSYDQVRDWIEMRQKRAD